MRLVPCVCMPSPIPRQDRWDRSLVLSHRLRPSPYLRRVSSCVVLFEACSAFTFITACLLAKPPKSGPLHQRLQQLRYLHCCSDCYRVERTSSRAGLSPLWTSAFHGARKYLNNVIEQDHRTVKKRVWLAKGYGTFQTAWRTLQGIETVHMIRKGRVRWLAKRDAVGQALFIAWLFGLAD